MAVTIYITHRLSNNTVCNRIPHWMIGFTIHSLMQGDVFCDSSTNAVQCNGGIYVVQYGIIMCTVCTLVWFDAQCTIVAEWCHS